MDLKYFSKKNKPEFNVILPKIRRYITTKYTCAKIVLLERDCKWQTADSVTCISQGSVAAVFK